MDLEELYKHIFKSLPTPIRQRAYRTLAMTDAATRHKLGITPTGYSFSTDYELHPERIMQKPFLKAMNGKFSPTQRAELGHKLLRGWCGGFLETTKTRIDHFGEGEIIQYSHRSIPEFLVLSDVRDEMASYLAGFDALDAVSQLLLADICLSRGRCYGASFIKALIAARHQAGLERAPYQFLKSLELAVRPVDQPALKAYDTDSVALEYAVQSDYSTSGWLVVTQAVSCSGQHRSVVRQELLHPICSCLQIRGHGYPLWKLRNDPSATKGATQMILLAYLIFQLQLRVPDFDLSHMTVLELLLETGLLDITTTLGLIEFSHSQFTLAPTSTGRLSVWQHFLVGGCVFRSLYARFIVAPKFVLRRNAALCDTVTLFLKHGAPQDFSAKGDSKTIKFWFGGGRGGDGRTKSFTLLFQGSRPEAPGPKYLSPPPRLSITEHVDRGFGPQTKEEEGNTTLPLQKPTVTTV